MKNKLMILLKQCLGAGVKKVMIRILFPLRNQFILFDFASKAKKNRVNVNYWRDKVNLGDAISPLIVNYMLNRKGLHNDIPISETRHLYAVGSIICAGIQDCTIWGSGVLNATSLYRLKGRSLDIRAIRGPLTWNLLNDYGISAPKVFGDPAILMPFIYLPPKLTKKYKYSLIAHCDEYPFTEGVHTISILTDDYKKFIDEIVESEVIISSSLHGIILAEVYGVQAVLLNPQGSILKYYDYYNSTGRGSFPVVNSFDEAKEAQLPELPDFTALQKGLMDVFPYDIYDI